MIFMKYIPHLVRSCRRWHCSATSVSVVFGILFFASAGWNIFRISEQGYWYGFQKDSQSLVEVRMIDTERGLSPLQGGNLRQNVPFFQHRGILDHELTKPYTSQFGLQGFVTAWITEAGIGPAVAWVRYHEIIVAALTCLTLALWVRWIGLEFNTAAAVLMALGIFFAPLPASMGRNLYWVPFTFYLPVLAACFGASRWLRNEQSADSFASVLRSRWVWLAVPLFVLVKCLCGYEYLSNLVLGCAVPFLYLGMREGLPFWKKIVPSCALVCALACTGFFVAFAIHLVFVTKVVLPDGGGFSAVMERISSNTIMPAHPMFQEMHGVKLYTMLIMKYLVVDAVDVGIKIPFGRGDFYFFKATYQGILAMLGLYTAGVYLSGKYQDQKVHAALWTALISWGLSFSWLFLAKGHQHHFHLNNWMFWLYAMPLTFACFGQALSIRSLPASETRVGAT
ncbi:MAG: hypothetical protein SFU85_13285 [Candidatus Methylacidiphilales bacterium]|nr:hypothetical protein [Candidatus Methylacidiphilales bacterium]